MLLQALVIGVQIGPVALMISALYLAVKLDPAPWARSAPILARP